MGATFFDTVRQSWGGLASHPLRTSLTAAGFGISMAIAAVLISAGTGLQESVGMFLRSMGEGQVVADPGRTTGAAGTSRGGREVRLFYKDLEGVEERLPSFDGVAPYMKLWGSGASSWKFSIPWASGLAVGVEYMKVRGLPLLEGRWFSDEEVANGAWVAVLNEGLRNMLFRDHEALGRWIEWRGRRLHVVGVVRDESSFPYIFFCPYETASQMADARYVSEILARPAPGADWDRAVAELRRVLGGIGGFDPADTNALDIEENRDYVQKVAVVTGALHILVLTIAAISLALGGLGVANMMVISVTERTREIGLRKALGATPNLVYRQVLVEACGVLVGGGVLGLVLGAVACALVRQLPLTASYAANMTLSLPVLLGCLLALSLVCVVAGSIPARRAAALPPVEALRWE